MRSGSIVRVLPVLILCGVAARVFAAEDDAAAWLERMIRSAHQLNYTGTFVYQQQGSLQSMKIVHAVDERGESERLVSLTGPHREVIRNSRRVTCILPQDSSIVVEHGGSQPPFPMQLPHDLKPIRDYYDIQLAGEDRIAGMQARKVEIRPRDRFRYGQNFWLANDSGLLLRSEIVNEQGEIVEQVMFTSLETHDSIPDSMLRPVLSDNSRVLHLENKPPANTPAGDGAQQWRVQALPPGFSQKLQRSHYLPEKRLPVEHHVYSDGLASVSVFIEQHTDGKNAFVGASGMGGVNAYGRILGSHSVTVVGEVPPVTVRQIAESLERVEP